MNHDGNVTDLHVLDASYVRTSVWIKAVATPQFTSDRPACCHECLVIAHQQGNPMKKREKRVGKQASNGTR